MEEYLNLIRHTLQNGSLERSRTDEHTLSTFGYNYTIDLSKGYPLITTKRMDNFRWDSMLHELEWYMSGKHHIRELTKKTGIWDSWADKNMNLPSAYGRFWRRYPVPRMSAQLSGESWIDESSVWTQVERTLTLRFVYGSNNENVVKKSMNRLSSILNTLAEGINTYISTPSLESNRTNQSVEISITVSHQDSRVVEESIEDIENKSSVYDSEVSESVLTFDQVQFIVDALNGDNPHRDPDSRRLVLNTWHPGNAQSSNLPPCHFASVFNVQSGKLNTHLTQRSADIALGVPFNIAAYSALNKLIAQQTGYESGHFNHTLVDAHIYCGKTERSKWYRKNIDEFQQRIRSAERGAEYRDIRDMIIEEASQDTGVTKPSEHNYGHDHIPGLLEQISRETLGRPKLNIDEGTDVNNVSYDNFELEDYESHKGISFTVAE